VFRHSGAQLATASGAVPRTGDATRARPAVIPRSAARRPPAEARMPGAMVSGESAERRPRTARPLVLRQTERPGVAALPRAPKTVSRR